MKTKKTLFLAAFAAVTLLSGYNYVKNNSEVNLSDLVLANVEALASGEGGTSCGFAAYEYDGDFYEDHKNFRRCGDCQWVSGTKPQYTNC